MNLVNLFKRTKLISKINCDNSSSNIDSNNKSIVLKITVQPSQLATTIVVHNLPLTPQTNIVC